MISTSDFTKRLELIFEYYSLNASSFSDKIGIQRSSLSHLMSGRNKPSLDIILKILSCFPEVDLYWIVNGKGVFPKINENQLANLPPIQNEINSKTDQINLFESENETKKISENNILKSNIIQKEIKDDDIDKIIIFYKNGTFEDFYSKKV